MPVLAGWQMSKSRARAPATMMVGQHARPDGGTRDTASGHAFAVGRTTLKAADFARSQKLSVPQDGSRTCIIQRSNPTESLGVQIGVSANTMRPRVTWLRPAGLAHGAGLIIGDYIVSINGADCAGSTNATVVKVCFCEELCVV